MADNQDPLGCGCALSLILIIGAGFLFTILLVGTAIAAGMK